MKKTDLNTKKEWHCPTIVDLDSEQTNAGSNAFFAEGTHINTSIAGSAS